MDQKTDGSDGGREHEPGIALIYPVWVSNLLAKTEKSNIWIEFGLRFCRSDIKEESKDIRVGSKTERERRNRTFVGSVLDKLRSTVKWSLTT